MTSQHRRRAHHGTFGNDRFGVLAERFARGFGTPQFIVGQTVIVALWISANALAVGLHWDPYPFILLNLAFSTQAAYAAPLILLAQTRQAERDKARDLAVQQHRDAQIEHQAQLESQLRRMLVGDRKREEALHALLARQSTLVDEIAQALELRETVGTPSTDPTARTTPV
jgi:uncharacterized membrane protein